MASFFVFKIRTSCAECGEGIVLDRPRLEARCEACGSVAAVGPDYWRNMLSLRSSVDEFHLTEGKTRGSSLSAGEQKFLISWGPQRPLCAGCNALLDLTLAPPGTTGSIACPCSATTPTSPPPTWLAQAEPAVLQTFGVPPEQPAGGAPVAASQAPAGLGLVSFACPDCGANLKVSPESPRVLRCHFCQCDAYLPDPLWRALHPVKKRTPFYLAFRN